MYSPIDWNILPVLFFTLLVVSLIWVWKLRPGESAEVSWRDCRHRSNFQVAVLLSLAFVASFLFCRCSRQGDFPVERRFGTL